MRRPLLVLGVAIAGVSVALALDPAAFVPSTFKNFQRQREEAGAGRDLILDGATPALAVAVKYTGIIRDIPAPRAAQIAVAARALGNTGRGATYHREIEVVEQGRTYALPAQDSVLAEISRLLNPGQELTAYVRYMGSSVLAPRLYLLIDFDAGHPKRLPRSACFARRLFGIGLGQPLLPVLRDLESRYGAPGVIRRGLQNLHVFTVDRGTGTYVAVADAGAGYRDRVFSVQVTGGPDTQHPAVFKTLRLGSSASEVANVLGKPARRVESGDGTTKLELPGSTCSVEMKDGVLASILIADDSNYFQE